MSAPKKRKSKYSGYGRFSSKSPKSSRRPPITQQHETEKAFLGTKMRFKAKKQMETQKRLGKDLERANLIQLSLMPKEIPLIKGYDIKVHYVSCNEIGGDYYDFIKIDDDHIGIVVADVSGKGISGAMIMTMARSVIRLVAEQNPDACETIKRVNQIMAPDIKNVMFLTMIYVVLNIKTNAIQVVNAGHNPLIHWNASKKQHEIVNPPGIAVGFDTGKIFDSTLKSHEMKMQKDDRMVVFTDGVVECKNHMDAEYGQDRLLSIIEETGELKSADFLNILVKDMQKFQGKSPQHDDVTVVALTYIGK